MLTFLHVMLGAMFGALVMIAVRGFEHRNRWPMPPTLKYDADSLAAIDAFLGEVDKVESIDALVDAHHDNARVRQVGAAWRDFVLAHRFLVKRLELVGEKRQAEGELCTSHGSEQRACRHMRIIVAQPEGRS